MTHVNDWTIKYNPDTMIDGTDVDKRIEANRVKVLVADKRRERINESNMRKKTNSALDRML